MAQISVCMATYNGEMYIHDQIASILPQLDIQDELIISDDGSTDNTLIIIKTFKDPRIILLKNLSPRSITHNFENALRHASGEYVFLSDQDDIWYPNKVLIITSYLERYDLVVSNCDFIDENGQPSDSSFFDSYHSGSGVFKNFFKNTFLGNCMAFRRRILIRALPFPNELHKATRYLVYQDVWLGILANVLFRVKFLPDKLSGFRRHSKNASPTGETIKSMQSLKRKLSGRTLLAAALLKRLLQIA